MTTAVCFKCGALKFGAFCHCSECKERPRTDDELTISLALTDHYFDARTLEEIGRGIKKHGRPPDLNDEARQQFKEEIQSLRLAGELDELYEDFEPE